MRTRRNLLYQILNRDYHESFDLYRPRHEEFYERVHSRLPAKWQIKRHGIWFHCGAPDHHIPHQGWKIHISATRKNAYQILDRVSALLFVAGDTDFKFALDTPVLCLLNSKNWPRAASGKFITIYPPTTSRFLDLIEELHVSTKDFTGPYILSDHRYKDSGVVFYRYGGMKMREALEISGERTPVLITPDGEEIPDQRRAYPSTPVWVELAVPGCHSGISPSSSHLLREGRFQVTGVIEFSSAGGVYRAHDLQTGKPVIIKEARPCVEGANGDDAIALLKKEFRLLTLLAETGIAPQPVELFQEETHWFLAEEYIQGVSLGEHSASHNILLRTRPSGEDYQIWYETFRRVALRLMGMVEILHSRDIVFSDLSPTNLIITDDGNDLKLIDFEGAYETGVDHPTNLGTPGFTSPSRSGRDRADRRDDYYAAGAVLMAYLLPINGLFQLKPHAQEEFLEGIQRDARLPESVGQLILTLMKGDVAPGSLSGMASAMLPSQDNLRPAHSEPEAPFSHASVVEGTIQHLLQIASYDRHDRLFPSDPKVFTTNPLGLAHGAAGIAYTLKKITGSIPPAITDWILARPVNADRYPPGLSMGLSGIAWALMELGECKSAETMLRLASEHPLRERSFDLFNGLAGWGLTSLHFFLRTGNEFYLDQAVDGAKALLKVDGSACSRAAWQMQASRPVGLAHGASGIALFLLYLSLLTNERSFLAAGQEALESDLSAAVETVDGGFSWGSTADSHRVLYPYWRYGSAGVGVAVLRFHKALGGDAYRAALDKIFIDTDRKYAVLPGRFMGLSGIGDFMLDAWAFTGDPKYLGRAQRIGNELLKFAVSRQGTAFPGDSLNRLSCDYGTGSAGIGLFLHRLLSGQSTDFVLDGLLSLNQRQEPRMIPVGTANETPAVPAA